MTRPWYEIENAREVLSPAILISPERVRENIRRMIADVGDVAKLRPHVKTHKLPQVVKMKLDAGIDKFKVATIAEAEMTSQAGGRDVLLAYQPVGPNIDRLVKLAKRDHKTRFSAVVDCPEVVSALGQAAIDEGVEIDLLPDIDVGMHRTGMPPDELAVELYRQIAHTDGVNPAGLHAYDGHLHEPNPSLLSDQAQDAFAQVVALKAAIESERFSVPKIVVGGTPTSALHAVHGDVEVGCGTTVLWDAGQPETSPALDYLNAAVLLTRVVSRPLHDLLCLDIGHKAVASEMPHPRVRLLGLDAVEPVVHSEEHLVVRTPQADHFPVGSVIYGIPWHICPTMALHSHVWTVEDHVAKDRWPVIARDRRLSI